MGKDPMWDDFNRSGKGKKNNPFSLLARFLGWTFTHEAGIVLWLLLIAALLVAKFGGM